MQNSMRAAVAGSILERSLLTSMPALLKIRSTAACVPNTARSRRARSRRERGER